MHLSHLLLALSLSFLRSVQAQPAHRAHHHNHKRIDWNDPALYAGVNWATVDYGGGAAAPAPATQPASPPATQAAPAAAETPTIVAQEKVAAQPSPAASPAASPSAAADTTTGSGKRGLAYNPTSPNLDVFDGYSKVTWGYNWDSSRGSLPSQFEFVPTLWSNKPDNVNSWNTNAKSAISGSGTSYLMSFNEPDIPAQANMDPGTAVAAFKQYMQPLASGNVKLGSPAVSNGVGTSPPQGINWIKPFLSQCTGCSISFVPMHWYGCNNGCPTSSDVSLFKQQVQTMIEAANGLPVWITEFQSFGDAEGFLAEVLPWLDELAAVERYAYFMVSDGILTQGGAVSALGKTYAGS